MSKQREGRPQALPANAVVTVQGGGEKAREPIMFIASGEFKKALDKYSLDNKLSRSEVVRQAVAEFIGYDLEGEAKRPRKNQKYASVEDRKKAGLERAKLRRELTRQLLEAYNAKDKEQAIAALVASLEEVE